MRPKPTSHHSWRLDPNVPDFDDARIVVVMDGECALCSSAARTIARFDKKDNVRICTAQSPLGQALFVHFGLQPGDPETWLMLKDGEAHGSLDAMITLFPLLHWVFAPLRVLKLLPPSLQDWLYARIARNRYKFFGRSDLCAVPDPALRQRLIG